MNVISTPAGCILQVEEKGWCGPRFLIAAVDGREVATVLSRKQSGYGSIGYVAICRVLHAMSGCSNMCWPSLFDLIEEAIKADFGFGCGVHFRICF